MEKLTTSILVFFMMLITINAQVTKTIDVTTPGTLTTLLTEDEKATITDLTVTGTIDVLDIKTMRDEIVLLENLFLTNATIAEYTGTEQGTAPSWFNNPTYPADVFPLYGFQYKNALISIALPESITKIARDALSSTANLETIIIGSQLVEIGTQAFSHAKKLNNIILPESLKLIGDASFSGCIGLNSIHIPAGVVEIRQYVFARDCPAHITVDDSNPNYSSLDGYVFNKDKTTLVVATAIYESYTVPESVTTIDATAFYMNTKIKSVTLPENLSLVSYSAFDGCTDLTTIYCNAEVPPDLLGYLVFRNVPKDGRLYVPVGSRDAYMAANQWNGFQNIVEMNVPTNHPNHQHLTIKLAVNKGKLYIFNAPPNTEVRIYNLTGQPIFRFNTQQSKSVALPKGIYLVKAGEFSSKIIVN